MKGPLETKVPQRDLKFVMGAGKVWPVTENVLCCKYFLQASEDLVRGVEIFQCYEKRFKVATE